MESSRKCFSRAEHPASLDRRDAQNKCRIGPFRKLVRKTIVLKVLKNISLHKKQQVYKKGCLQKRHSTPSWIKAMFNEEVALAFFFEVEGAFVKANQQNLRGPAS